MKRILLFMMLPFLGMLQSCEDIIAKDITGEIPEIILPTQQDTIASNPVHFKWSEINGATRYHLHVVSPSFDAIDQYVLDTLVEGTSFFYSLDSNEYEMKLVGVNAGYESFPSTIVKFWVGVSAEQPVSGNGVVLLNPTDTISSTGLSSFSWEAVTGATSYDFDIKQGASFQLGTPVSGAYAPGLTSTFRQLSTPLGEGAYYWGVRANFADGSSGNVTTRRLLIDPNTPEVPQLINPTQQLLTSASTIAFEWDNGTEAGSFNTDVTSRIYFAYDNQFNNIYDSMEVVNGNTIDVDLQIFNDTLYWRLRNIDQAGNKSNYSSTRILYFN